MDKRIEKLALGTVQFGMHYGIANKEGRTDSNEVNRILDYAYKNNINSLDTANSYGESETVLGKYIFANPEKDWDVFTKIKSAASSAKNQINDSLLRLSCNPNGVLAHSKSDYLNPKFYECLCQLKEDKIVQMIGVSVYNHQDIDEILSFNKPDIIQIPLNILDTRLYLDGTLNDLVSKGIIVHIRSVFLQGLFYLSKDEIKRSFFDVLKELKNLEKIANKTGLTIAELSLLWIASLKFDGKIIIGVDTLEQLKTHLYTLTKNVDDDIFNEALKINYQNEKILNPSLW